MCDYHGCCKGQWWVLGSQTFTQLYVCGHYYDAIFWCMWCIVSCIVLTTMTYSGLPRSSVQLFVCAFMDVHWGQDNLASATSCHIDLFHLCWHLLSLLSVGSLMGTHTKGQSCPTIHGSDMSSSCQAISHHVQLSAPRFIILHHNYPPQSSV